MGTDEHAAADEVSRLAAWRSRTVGEPVAAVHDGSAVCFFAEDRLLAFADDVEQMTTELDAGLRFEPLPDPEPLQLLDRSRRRDASGAPRLGTLVFDGTRYELEDTDEVGPRRSVTSRAGAGTVALAQELRRRGLRVGLDCYGDFYALPATSASEGTGPAGTVDAYALEQNNGRSGLVEAWQLIEAHRLLGGNPAPVQVGIIDGGFWFDPVTGACRAPRGVQAEFPGLVPQHDLVGGGPRAGGPNPGNGSEWHGQGTAAVALAPHGDRAGVAGAGGSVATPFLFRTNLAARQVIQGLRLSVAWGVDVVNMSFGIEPNFVLGLGSFPEEAFEAMFEWAEQNGVVVVAAAGNAGARLPGLDVRPATRTPGVVTVGALAARDSTDAAGFSNYGVSVDLWAPGQRVWVGPDGRSDVLGLASGTSVAAPLVAGAAGMVIALHTDVHGRRPTAGEVRDVLTRTAWRSATDPKVTAGLDAAAALWSVLGGRFRSETTEPNDTAAAARPLVRAAEGRWVPSVTGPRALASFGDADWWLLEVDRLSSIQVRLEAFERWGLPTLLLQPDDPESLVGEEMVQGESASTRTIDAAVVPPGRYRIGVVGGRTLYDLTVEVAPTVLGADEWERNDTLATASQFSMREHLTVDLLGAVTHPRGSYEFTLHAGDVDYLRVQGVPVHTGGARAEVQVGVADALVTTEVLDASGRPLRRTTSQYYAGRLNLEPGTCYVRVSGNQPTRYLLTLTMMADLTLPPIKIPVDLLAPWELESPLLLMSSEQHFLITVDPSSPVRGLEVHGDPSLALEVLDPSGGTAVRGVPSAGGVQVDTSGLAAGQHLLRISRPTTRPGVRRIPLRVTPVLGGTGA